MSTTYTNKNSKGQVSSTIVKNGSITESSTYYYYTANGAVSYTLFTQYIGNVISSLTSTNANGIVTSHIVYDIVTKKVSFSISYDSKGMVDGVYKYDAKGTTVVEYQDYKDGFLYSTFKPLETSNKIVYAVKNTITDSGIYNPNIKAPVPVVTEAPTKAPAPVVTEAPTKAPVPIVTEAPTKAPVPVVTEQPKELSKFDISGNTELHKIDYTNKAISSITVYEGKTKTEELTFKNGLLYSGKFFTPEYINAYVQKNDQNVGHDTTWSSFSGWGSINATKALNELLGTDYVDTKSTSIVSQKFGSFSKLHELGYDGTGVTIAVIDTGVDIDNKVLSKNLVSGYNLFDKKSSVDDAYGHGSKVVSVISGYTNSAGTQFHGAADSATIMPIKVSNSASVSMKNVADGVILAVDSGANVINISITSLADVGLLQEKSIKYAHDHGVIVVVGAGNDGGSLPGYPAYYAKKYDNVIAVGSVSGSNTNNQLVTSSTNAGNSDSYNFVSAIGAGSIYGNDQYGNVVGLSGTSFAAPLVASEIACLIEAEIKQEGSYDYREIVEAVSNNTDIVSLVGTYSLSSYDHNILLG